MKSVPLVQKANATPNAIFAPVPVDFEGAPLATAAELEAGTETEVRLVSPKLIHDEIARQIAAIP